MPGPTRTRLTWLLYSVNGVAAFFVYSVGPSTPLIAEDLGITPQVAALHGTAMAAALLTAGAVTTPSVTRWGRAGVLIRAMLVMAVGVGLVLVAPVVAVSLLGAYLAGTGGAVAAVAANATLADEHPEEAPTVLTEANAAAAWVGLFAPLLMGLFLGAGLGWRAGLALAIPGCAVVAVGVGRLRHQGGALGGRGQRGSAVSASERQPTQKGVPLALGPTSGPGSATSADPASAPAAASATTPGGDRIPRTFWVVMLAASAAAGAEFGVNYWGASLLVENTAGAASTVTAAMSAPVAGVAVGRTLGARLALRLSAHSLLTGGWIVALVGFALFWKAGSLALATTGMFVIGLGLSVIYPLLLDRAVLFMPDRSDKAMALVAPFVGAAIGLAPFVLGALAAAIGISSAFLIVPLMMVVGLGAVLGSRPSAA